MTAAYQDPYPNIVSWDNSLRPLAHTQPTISAKLSDQSSLVSLLKSNQDPAYVATTCCAPC